MHAAIFEGKAVLVTGGGSGIGRSASQLLARNGASVAVADLDVERALQTVALIERAGGRAIAIAADVASEADNIAMFDGTEQAFGGIDHAFLNAGMLQRYLPFEDVSIELFDRFLSVNLRGVFLGLQQARSRLRPQGSCVVTASAAALLGFSEAAAYATSKHGALGLVRSAARFRQARSAGQRDLSRQRVDAHERRTAGRCGSRRTGRSRLPRRPFRSAGGGSRLVPALAPCGGHQRTCPNRRRRLRGSFRAVRSNWLR